MLGLQFFVRAEGGGHTARFSQHCVWGEGVCLARVLHVCPCLLLGGVAIFCPPTVFVFYSCLVLNGARLLIHAAHARETRARASVCTYPCDTRATLRPKALQCTGHVSVILAAGMHAVRPARHTLYDQRLVELATATCTGRLGKTSGNVGLV